MGAPQPVYYGGLVMSQVRHFDDDRERPGLPEGVSALVERVDASGIDLTLVNSGGQDRNLIVQAGAYGEHDFETIRYDGVVEQPTANALRVSLPSGSRLSIDADLGRFTNDPSYELPWA